MFLLYSRGSLVDYIFPFYIFPLFASTLALPLPKTGVLLKSIFYIQYHCVYI